MLPRWNRGEWAARSSEFLRRHLMQQREFDLFLARRWWLEQKLNGFRLGPLLDGDGNAAAASDKYNDVVDKVKPRLLLYGSSIAGTAFEHGDADFAIVFPSPAPLNRGPTRVLQDTATADNLSRIPVDTLSFIGGCVTIPRQVQPTVLTALYHHMAASSSSTAEHTPSEKHPQLQRIFRARIPILQYVPTLAELQLQNRELLPSPSGGATQAPVGTPIDASQKAGPSSATSSQSGKHQHYDMSLSIDGARNSLLIRKYMELFPQLRAACLILKQWGRQKKILNARRGWISPYAFTIMLIHYMIECKAIEAPLDVNSVDAILSQLSETLLLPEPPSRDRGELGANSNPNPTAAKPTSSSLPPSVGAYGHSEFDSVLPWNFDERTGVFEEAVDHVRGFFDYYGGDTGKFDTDAHVVDIRSRDRWTTKDEWQQSAEFSSLSDAEKWHRLGYGCLMIRDPYEPHSLGRSVEFFRCEAIREELRVAGKEGVDLQALLPLTS